MKINIKVFFSLEDLVRQLQPEDIQMVLSVLAAGMLHNVTHFLFFLPFFLPPFFLSFLPFFSDLTFGTGIE